MVPVAVPASAPPGSSEREGAVPLPLFPARSQCRKDSSACYQRCENQSLKSAEMKSPNGINFRLCLGPCPDMDGIIPASVSRT